MSRRSVPLAVRRLAARPFVTGAVALATLALACEANVTPAPGAIMLAVSTDLTAPRDIASVGLFITSDGRPIYSITRDVAPTGEVKFPATIAILADDKRANATVRIRVVGFSSSGSARILRDAITTVPKDRTALMRMPLSWLSDGSATGTRTQADAALDGLMKLVSKCTKPDETSIDGTCADAHVDSSKLPTYVESEVFGGGKGDGTGGTCFDVAACFKSASVVSLDTSCTARIAGAAGDASLSLGVALKRPATGTEPTGECLENGYCIVPLDKDLTWSASGDTVKLPPAVCERIGRGEAAGVVATRACRSKTASAPACGPAAATAGAAERPDGGATTTTPLDFDAGPTGDAGSDATIRPQDGGPDGGPLPDGATPDGGPVDAGADGLAPLDGGGDAGSPLFGPVVDYLIGEPSPSNFRFDGTRLYVARALNGTLEPNVLGFDLAQLLANPTTPTARVVFFTPADTTGPMPPLWDLGFTTAGAPVALAGSFNVGIKYLGCTLGALDGGPPCAQTGALNQPFPTGATVALAAAPHRVFVATTVAPPPVATYSLATNTWSSFEITGASAPVTALHYMRSTQTLLVGFANGDIFRCPDTAATACNGANGAFYSPAPTGGGVRAFTDDGASTMYWATEGKGIYRDAAGTLATVGDATSADPMTTSLAVDATYLYAPRGTTLNAFPITGAFPSGVLVASGTNPVIAVASTPEHVFFSAPFDNNPTSIKARCKRFLNAGCN